MKYLTLFLMSIILSSCDEFKPKEIIVSDKGKEWKVDIIEGHEFLYRCADRSVPYIHRPNCKSCKLN